LHGAEKGLLTQKQAGLQLRLSERWVRKLLARRLAHTPFSGVCDLPKGPLRTPGSIRSVHAQD